MLIKHERGPAVAHPRPARSAVSETWHRPDGAAGPPAQIPDHELAELIARAASLGVPAWRVRAALGLPPTATTSDADARPPQ
jgi:hypothetical protein